MTRVTPAGSAKARVAVAVMADETLTDSQLIALSQGGSAQIVQVILPKDDCKLQEQALQSALGQLKGPATLVSGIGPGAALAWRWLATQSDDKANAISVGFALVQEGCKDPLPKTSAHGNWLVAWNDNPDDESASFVRDTPRATTSISDYDIHSATSAEQRATQATGGFGQRRPGDSRGGSTGRPGQGHRHPVSLR